ncbi:MAG TPA: DUF885 domain-containing protein [Polyangia bacterium]|nr:DUF885 domain-containing protein [Polyangia bacterium]
MTRLPAIASLLAAALAIGATPGCRSHPRPEQWDAHVQRFLDDYFRANPTFAVYQGKHEYDGRFPDWSSAGLQAEVARLHRERDLAAAFDTSKLDELRRFQRDYLLAAVDRDLFWLEEARSPWTNPAYYGDLLDPNVYVARPYAALPVRMKALTDWASRVPAALAQIRATLQTPMPLPLAEIGKIRFGGVGPYLENDVPQVFASVTDPALRAPFDRARLQAAAAFREMGAWFDQLEASPAGSFALGAEKYQKMLWMTERVRLTVDQAEAIGRADLDRNRQALAQECARYAPGKTLPDCMEKMNAHKSTQGSVAAARAQLAGLEAFIVEKDLVTIPGPEQAEVRESPPYMRWNFAYIDPPGPYEHGLPAVYYVAPPDPSWTEKQKADYLPGTADLLFASVHEVWPGHFLQFLHSNRSRDLFGRVFVGYAFAEGWAHYSEEMMWEAGLGAGDPEIHIGQLSNALLRNARFLSSIGMHARGMTQAQAQQLFREQALQSEPTARQQAARGTFDPAYLNYTLGKLTIRQMREDWSKTHGGRSSWKAFHDQLLSHGGPPIGLLRDAVLSRGSP